MPREPTPRDARSNPFATRFTRPGALAYRFTANDPASVDELLQRLEHHGWQGQIAGPHGSGKSTLLAMVIERLESANERVAAIALHDGQRRLPAGFGSDEGQGPPTLWIIDGYEQLGWPARLGVAWRRWRRGVGLLVTSHRPVRGLPVVCVTRATTALAQGLAQQLAPAWAAAHHATIAAEFVRAGGDLRELWFRLYDLYEMHRPSDQAADESGSSATE